MESAGISKESEEEILQKVAAENALNNSLAMRYPLLNQQMQSQSQSKGSTTKEKKKFDLKKIAPKINLQNKKKGGQSGRIKLG